MSSGSIVLTFGLLAVPVELTGSSDGARARAFETDVTLTVRPQGNGAYAITCNGRRLIAHHATRGGIHYLHVDGETYTFERQDGEAGRRDAAVRSRPAAGHHDLRAPMPGVVTQIFVEEGQIVETGAPLYVVEAMKIENLIRAPFACRVTSVRASPGAQVDGGAVVVEVDAVEEGSRQ